MPPPERENMKWVEIADFSPGIWSSRAVPNAPLGAAATGTYGCVATSDGCLAPGPKSVSTFTQAMLGTGSRPTGQNRMVALASHYMGPVHSYDSANVQWTITASNLFAEELAITYGQFIDPASGSAWQYRTDNTLYKLWAASPPSTYTIKSVNSATMRNGSAFASPWTHGYADYAMGIEQGVPNLPHLYSALQHFRGATFEVRAFPAKATPTTDSNAALTNPGLPIMVLGHQGRIVTVNNVGGFDAFGASAGIFGANDLWYWPVRNQEAGTSTTLYKPVEENQSGIAAIASMSANELFLIKNEGGGALIRGDLDNPNVLRMPTWHSTQGYLSKPVATPAGLIYGGRMGVFSWAGAEATASIAPQMEADYPSTQPFWDVNTTLSTDIDRVGYNGQFSFLYPWVLVPNNWMFDIRHKSWWKLGQSATPSPPMFSYHATWDGAFWGISAYVDGTQTTAATRFDPNQQAASYAWYSQPITLIQGRRIQIRQVSVVANAPATSPSTSTVDVTIVAADSSGNNAELIATTSHGATAYPTLVRCNASIPGDSFQVIAVGTSTGSNQAAPTIRSIRIGYTESTQNPAA